MSLAMFKLESFSKVGSPHSVEVSFTRSDLERAYADGHASASAECETAQLQQLSDCLAALAAGLSDDQHRRASLRAEAVAALAPILTQILDLMASPSESRRLEETLTAELARLAARSTPLRARISCGPPLREMVRRCLQDHDLGDIEIESEDAAQVSIRLEGGRIDLDQAGAARDIAALIADIREDAGSWTH